MLISCHLNVQTGQPFTRRTLRQVATLSPWPSCVLMALHDGSGGDDDDGDGDDGDDLGSVGAMAVRLTCVPKMGQLKAAPAPLSTPECAWKSAHVQLNHLACALPLSVRGLLCFICPEADAEAFPLSCMGDRHCFLMSFFSACHLNSIPFVSLNLWHRDLHNV